MDNTIAVKTVSPFHSPLSLALGVDQSSDAYQSLMTKITKEHERFLLFHQSNSDLDYDAIDVDARDNRILVWQAEPQSPIKIHLFPNNVAIAEQNISLPAGLSAAEIAEQSQAQAKSLLAEVYQGFVEDMQGVLSLDQDQLLRFDKTSTSLDIHWVSRFLLFDSPQLSNLENQSLLEDWLKDTEVPDDATAIIKGDIDHSMTWLQYVIVDPQGNNDSRVDTMILAQYYYTAQENCNSLLKQAIDSAYNSNNVSDTEKKLSFSRVVTRLHLIELNEHRKFLNRQKRKRLNKVLTSWDFDNLVENGQRMIEVCSARLEEADNKRRERSTVMTDLLLVTLSFFAVFELSLYLTEFSREMMSRPALDYNDENTSFFLRLIAEIDVDVMFASGFGLTLALVIAYRIMKGK